MTTGDVIIDVQALGKSYQLEPERAEDSLVETFLRRWSSGKKQRPSFWALRDVSFTIERGEIVGIIGPNGAGKSTLLKILSRITAPTEGRAVIRGRVGSLLEVGTGFHPELTGRENVFLSGAILGMSRSEIKRDFEEIVAFSEVSEFLDVPVKRFSSGMQVRLAFAVAAHLQPDVLVIDEVLAVGDSRFVKKCLGKMGEVARDGRTVLFVSHSMATVQRLCSRALMIDRGTLVSDGNPLTVTDEYLTGQSTRSEYWERLEPKNDIASVDAVRAVDAVGQTLTTITTGSPLTIEVSFSIRQLQPNLQLSVGLLDANGDQILGTAPEDSDCKMPVSLGQHLATVRFPTGILLEKTYGVRVALWRFDHGQTESLEVVDALQFAVEAVDTVGTRAEGGRPGHLFLQCAWSVESPMSETSDL